MIYRMTQDLAERLHARKYPVRVSYGPERCDRGEYYSATIVVEHDRSRSGVVGAPQGQQRNPRKSLVRTQPVVATIYAQAPVAGARVAEHEDACDKIVDGFLSELANWQTEARAGSVTVTEARFLERAERDDVETWPGAVYVLRFLIPRAVDQRDYEGLALDSAVIANANTAVRVTLDGTNYEEI